MPGPSLADKKKFFPAVLRDAEFQRKGVLFGETPELANECKWVVVDPNRHKLVIWKKPNVSADFVECGKALKASVFTNGPMIHSRYERQFNNVQIPLGTTGLFLSSPKIDQGLSKGYSGMGYVGAELQKAFSGAAISIQYWGANLVALPAHLMLKRFGENQPGLAGKMAGDMRAMVSRADEKHEERDKQEADDRADMEWFVAGPYGDVIGKDGSTPTVARAGNQIDVQVGKTGSQLGYFGRDAGTNFESYKIGKDNPQGLVEASGGLYDPEVLDGKVTALAVHSNMWFHWGLAPLKPEPRDEAGLKDALAAYAASPGNRPVGGLIVGVYYHDDPAKVQVLADVGVTDAVRLDGGDSVLFGYDQSVLVGTGMSHHKRTWMQFGFAFFPVQ